MTRKEALQLLSLAEGCNPAAVRAAYEHCRGELESRRNAATPAALAAWVEQAKRLVSAREALLTATASSSLSATQLKDLPIAASNNTAVSAAPALSATQLRDLPLPAPRETMTAASTPWSGDAHRDTLPAPASRPSVKLAPGTVLANRYEIRRLLGEGGMGIVYAAHDRTRGEEIALKVLQPHLLGDATARKRFDDEAKIASGLSHAAIVRVYDLHHDGARTFLTMELLKGRNLREEIVNRAKACQRFTVDEVRRMGGQLCAALQEAHKQTVHRDVKPENIWLCEDGAVKLMDFGIARLMRPSQFTSTGLALGTAYYMAPEQLKGSKDIDHRADQYALGVVLYELLTGQIPIGAVRPPHQVRKNVPPELSEAIMKALAGDPAERHADMAAFAESLSSHRRTSTRTRWLTLAAALALLVGAVVTYPSWRTHLTPAEPASVQVGPRAEEKAAAVEYGRKLGELEELRRRAEQVEPDLLAQEKATHDEVERCQRDLSSAIDAKQDEQQRLARERLQPAQTAQALAAEVAALWRKHPQRPGWLPAANGNLGAARTLAQAGGFVEAAKELDKAEPLLRFPTAWRTNARESVALRQQGAVVIRERRKRLDGAPPTLLAWPESLFSKVPVELGKGEGGEGLTLARQARDWLDQTKDLYGVREELAKERSTRPSVVKSAELRAKYQEIDKLVNAGDDRLARGDSKSAQAPYEAATEHTAAARSVVANLTKLLLQKAQANLHEPNSEVARAALEELLRLDPANALAKALWAQLPGQFLVFSALAAKGNREILLVNTDGSMVKNLTNGKADNSAPAWSSDGQKIAFVSDRDGRDNIYVMDPDGTNLHQLTKGGARGPTWSPDSKNILSFRSSDNRCCVMDAHGKNLRPLLKGGSTPSWSPDGKALIFASYDYSAKANSMILMDVDSGEEKQVGYGSDPRFSADGTKILFRRDLQQLADESSVVPIFVMDADGSNVRKIVDVNGLDWHWSPDGKKLLFLRDGGREEGFAQFLNVADVDSGSIHKIISSSDVSGIDIRRDWSWSPDSKKVAWWQMGGIFIADADGNNRKQVTTASESLAALITLTTWSPDSTKIGVSYYYRRGATGRSGYYVMDAAGTNRTWLFPSEYMRGGDLPVWRPN